MTYGVGLTAILVLLWLTLSGHYTLAWDNPLLIGFGVFSVISTVALAVRMRILDRETVPVAPAIPLMIYWGWLGREILNANLAVLRLVMKPEIDVEPRLVRVPAGQRSELGHTVFANSITLTPGTVTIDVEDNAFLVHALDTSFTDPSGFAEMGKRSDIATDGKRKAD